MARYEKHDEGEGKFWEITMKGLVVSTRAGKIGAGASRDRDGVLYLYDRRGRTTERAFDDPAAAQREYDKLVKAKTKDGFKLVEGPAPVAEIEVHRNPDLEAAIATAPDEDGAYLVYADWLIARDDPRGELITLQRAMRGQDDPTTFMKFKKAEETLRTKHLASWLGPIAGPALHRLKLTWSNGFVIGIRIDGPDNETETSLADLLEAVLTSPLLLVLRELTLRGTSAMIADAVPHPPPRHLRKLRLEIRAEYEPRTDDARQRNKNHVELYEALGITVETSSYRPEDRYVPIRE